MGCHGRRDHRVIVLGFDRSDGNKEDVIHCFAPDDVGPDIDEAPIMRACLTSATGY